MNQVQEWWKDPRGIAAAVALFAIVLGLFWSREKLLWDLMSKSDLLTMQVDKQSMEFGVNERAISAVRDRMSEHERRLEINAQRILRMEGIIDRIYQQGDPIPKTARDRMNESVN